MAALVVPKRWTDIFRHKTMVFNNKYFLNWLLFPITLVLILFSFTFLKIHGSSVGFYNLLFYGSDYDDPNLVFGVPRFIRSDEWLVSTPWIISQMQNNFDVVNDLYMPNQNFGTNDIPARHWVTLFKPQNWAFFFLPVENAFAFRWWFPSLLMMIALYWVFMVLINRNVILSIIGAASIFFSPFIQWWFSQSIILLIAYGSITFICIIKLIRSSKLVERIAFTSGMIYSLISFILILYPPFQIPIVWFFCLIALGYILNKRIVLRFQSLLFLVLSIGITAIVCYLYYSEFEKIITSIAGSVYPGNRVVSGGDLSIQNLLVGFFNIQLLNDRIEIPPIFGNQSEAASFFFLGLFLLPLIIYNEFSSFREKKNIDWISICLIVYCFLMLGWGFGFLPDLIGRLLFLDRVPGRRLLSGLGLANQFALIYFAHHYFLRKRKDNKILTAIFSILVSSVILWEGFYLKANFPHFIGNEQKIILISIAFGVIFLLLTWRRPYISASLFLIVSMGTTLMVNPIYKGLSPLLTSKISSQIADEIIQDPKVGWVIYDSLIYGNYFSAAGAVSFNGAFAAPNIAFWQQFDPDLNDEDIYNRYAHVLVKENALKDIRFDLIQQDVFSININPCNLILDKIGVKYFVFQHPANYQCLSFHELINMPSVSLYIYRRE